MSRPVLSSNLTGQRFGLLTAAAPAGRARNGEQLWRCTCDCGGEKVTRRTSLIHGGTRSCGCMLRGSPHRFTRGGASKHRLYNVWRSMIARCRNPKGSGYDQYGGRGIKVCDRWLDFDVFLADVGPSYIKGLTLDRVDTNGHYEPGNWRWATYVEQVGNRRTTAFVEYRGERTTFADAWRASGSPVSQLAAWNRYSRYGWPLDEAFSRPKLAGRRSADNPTCINGHPRIAENLSYLPNGRPRCRLCLAAAQRRCKARKMAEVRG